MANVAYRIQITHIDVTEIAQWVEHHTLGINLI